MKGVVFLAGIDDGLQRTHDPFLVPPDRHRMEGPDNAARDLRGS